MAIRIEFAAPPQVGVNQHSSAEAKIALFRSLFRGREDVYPQRFESRKTGRAGYSPACDNEWVRGICEKPRIKCSECPHQRFLPVTDEVVRWHLSGHDDQGRGFVTGVHPMLRDETCFLLAADFDKATWQDDAGAFLETCRQMNLPAALERSRSGNGGRPLNLNFRGELRPEQAAAAQALLAHDTGVLAATTAFGKTVVAAWLIAQRDANTLVLVHRRQLQQQWIERLSTFLGMPTASIGRIGGGRKKPTGLLDVAVIQSLVRKGVVADLAGDYGHVIVDECHHLSAQSFEQVVRQAKARFVTGLSATVTRKDGHHPIIFMQCGPVRFRVSAKQGTAAHPLSIGCWFVPRTFVPFDRPIAMCEPNSTSSMTN